MQEKGSLVGKTWDSSAFVQSPTIHITIPAGMQGEEGRLTRHWPL